MKKIWLLLFAIVLGGCNMSDSANEETDDELYDYELTTTIENESYFSFDFFYGVNLNSEDYTVIKGKESYEFKRTIKVKDDENGVPQIEVDDAPDCYLRIHNSSNGNYTAVKFSYENVRKVLITATGDIVITPTVTQ